jgi:acyl-CoA hydrolase/RimJ/RimL family protein N-acetyltransferase
VKSWHDRYRSKVMTARQAMGLIRPGAKIFIGSGCGQPQSLVEALVAGDNAIADAEIYHYLTNGPAPYIGEAYGKKFRTHAFFVGANIRDGIQAGRGDYIPIFLSDIPSLFKSGRIPLDAALIQTSPPDEHGHLSLGISVDIVKAAAENSLLIIAEVNPRMPRTRGESFIPADMVDAVVETDRELIEYRLPESGEVTRAIARNVADLVEDGSTIEVGIGTISQAVLEFLEGKNDLGVHTEGFHDAIMPLIAKGVINGSRKTINRGKVTASSCFGTRKLYDFVDDNPVFEFRPSDYVNDPYVISQHHRMVAINAAIEVDMTGQAAADSLGYDFLGGFGGKLDFNRGAAMAREGKSIVALASTARGGSVSRIVPRLTEGAGVGFSRAGVRFVVTEFGSADLFGKSIRERIVALAEIAHPDFRNELLRQARERHYVYPHQHDIRPDQPPRGTFTSRRTLTDGTEALFRPVRASDATRLRDMFYQLSEKSILFRFFQPMAVFPDKFVQDLCAIDLSRDMAVVALVHDTGGEQIVGIAHFFPGDDGLAEISFLVRDDWQDRGIGTDLLGILTDIARERGLAGFKTRMLMGNHQMMAVFQGAGHDLAVSTEDDQRIVTYRFDDRAE